MFHFNHQGKQPWLGIIPWPSLTCIRTCQIRGEVPLWSPLTASFAPPEIPKEAVTQKVRTRRLAGLIVSNWDFTRTTPWSVTTGSPPVVDLYWFTLVELSGPVTTSARSLILFSAPANFLSKFSFSSRSAWQVWKIIFSLVVININNTAVN